MNKKSLIAIIVIAVVFVAIGVKLVQNKKVINANKEFVDRSKIPVAVNVATAKIMDFSGDISRPAVVEPNETAVIAASMPGKLVTFNIDLGTRVSKGEKIGKIDTKTLDVQLASAKLALSKMKTDFDRNKALYEGNALSETQFLDSKFGYEQRQLDVQQLEEQIDQAYIKSPLSGVIVDRKNIAGEFVGAGNPLATVVDVNTLKIFVSLNQSEIRFIKLGQQPTIKAAIYPNKTFTGKVVYIAPSADQNYNYKVEIDVDVHKNKELKAGMYVNVTFAMNHQEEVLQIPKKALAEGVKNAYVYVQNGDRAEKRSIHVGRENGNYIEVLSGLKAGEKVVVDGQINIVDKSLIKAKETK